jgi:YD repeat-containing protein
VNASGALTAYAYDAANQLQTSQASAGVTTYTFDANGHRGAYNPIQRTPIR